MKDHWGKRLISVSDRVYWVLLKILTSEFRRQYGALIAQAFHNLSREAYAERGSVGLIWLWMPSATDVIESAIAEQSAKLGRNSMKLLRKRLEPLRFWGKWIIATGAGLYAGWILNLIFRPLLVLNRIDLVWPVNDLETVYRNLDLPGYILLSVLSGLITGAIVGLFQWLALLRKAGDWGWWLPATAIGFGIDCLLKALFFSLYYVETSGGQLRPPQGSFLPFLFAIVPLMGALFIGLSQWLVMRRKVQYSGWWILAAPIATILALRSSAAMDVLNESFNAWIMRLASITSIGVVPLTKIAYPLPYLFEGIIVGAFTGMVIVMLVRRASKQSHLLTGNDPQLISTE